MNQGTTQTLFRYAQGYQKALFNKTWNQSAGMEIRNRAKGGRRRSVISRARWGWGGDLSAAVTGGRSALSPTPPPGVLERGSLPLSPLADRMLALPAKVTLALGVQVPEQVSQRAGAPLWSPTFCADTRSIVEGLRPRSTWLFQVRRQPQTSAPLTPDDASSP